MGGQEIALTAAAEHVELTAEHLVVGLELCWQNRTAAPISVKDIQLRLALSARSKEALHLYPLERFQRLPGQRALQKKPMRPFTLSPAEPHTEQIRFISQEVRDIPVGRYAAEVEIKDIGDVIYINDFTLRVEREMKFRRTEEWEHD